MEYAHGLAERGHQVTLVPTLPSSEKPLWFDRDYGVYVTTTKGHLTRWFLSGFGGCLKQCVPAVVDPEAKARLKSSLLDLACSTGLLRARLWPYELRLALALYYVRRVIPPADVTIATHYTTALPTWRYGRGRLYYFMQHFEPYFAPNASDPRLAELESLTSYRLGLRMIANSSWLKEKVEREVPGSKIDLCLNAVNHAVFNGEPRVAVPSDEIKVISFGGSRMEWKGFDEMAQAVRMTRRALPNLNIRWLVYGSKASLPPGNPVAPYEECGFMQPRELAALYKQADILLSASWYESFPLFPLEAMACGLPVVTTRYGTEDYAIPRETAEVVEPKNPESVASGLIRLITDIDYRNSIASKGNAISKKFTWEHSVATMESILLSHV